MEDFFYTWLLGGLSIIEIERGGGGGRMCDLCVVRSSAGAAGVIWMRKNISLPEQRRRKMHAKRIFFMMQELKDCTRRARFKICALATACTGLVEIQTLRSVYETQIKKTV